MLNGPLHSVQPITLNGSINGRTWSFTIAPTVDTGGRGFILNPDPEKPSAQVCAAGSCLSLVHAVQAAREYRFTPLPSIHPVRDPVSMLPLVDLPDSPAA